MRDHEDSLGMRLTAPRDQFRDTSGRALDVTITSKSTLQTFVATSYSTQGQG